MSSDVRDLVPEFSFEEFRVAAQAEHDAYKAAYDALPEQEKDGVDAFDFVTPPGDDPSSFSEEELRQEYRRVKAQALRSRRWARESKQRYLEWEARRRATSPCLPRVTVEVVRKPAL